MTKSKKRKITWSFIIAFLLGALFGEITADPFSDFIFFWRESTGIPMSPEEQLFYWYYVPGIIYAILFVAAILVMMIARVKAVHFAIVIGILAAMSLVISLRFLGTTIGIIFLLVIPLILLIYILFFETSFKLHGKSHRF